MIPKQVALCACVLHQDAERNFWKYCFNNIYGFTALCIAFKSEPDRSDFNRGGKNLRFLKKFLGF